MRNIARLILMVIITFVSGCTYSPEEQARYREQQERELSQRAISNIQSITYLKDSRTGLCYAYLWERLGRGDHSTGGPALTWVPCDSIPVDMLLVE